MGNQNNIFSRIQSGIYKIGKGMNLLTRQGPLYTTVFFMDRWQISAPRFNKYRRWMFLTDYREEELEAQRADRIKAPILVSIVVPLYNTPVSFLRDMIESVQRQTYQHWQLCLADGSDNQHREVEKICEIYARRDGRIRYRKLGRNLGISGNTNAAIAMAEGNYIALLDHDDILHPAALYELMQAARKQGADLIYTDEATFQSPNPKDITLIHFKPDFAPDNLRANNYICHFTAFRRSLLAQTEAFRSGYDGSQDHDLVLRLSELADHIIHIPKVLYFWRAHPQSAALDTHAKEYAYEAGKKAVLDSLARQGISARGQVILPGVYRISYPIPGNPKVSIIIPSCDHIEDLRRCLRSIRNKTTYKNYEIIIVENNSKNPDVFSYYEKIQAEWDRVRIIKWPGSFNYSAINNFAVKETGAGPYLLLLNNDTEVISKNWIQEMLMHACRPEVGAVGAKLYYPDDTIQHAGVILGMHGMAGHCYKGVSRDSPGYMGRLVYTQNLSAVTGACMMVRRDVWDQVGGLDELFKVSFNDTDLCMRIRKAGYLIVWTPWAELYHMESASRGYDHTNENHSRFCKEVARFRKRWKKELEAGDPYYNPNLKLDGFGFEPDSGRSSYHNRSIINARRKNMK